MILMIDNYDSFTYNLVHVLAELGARVRVVRNDAISVEEAVASRPEAIVLSPGPKAPSDAGILIPLIEAAPDDMPIFGVCLGMQAIGQAFGGKVVRAQNLMHGKVSPIRHESAGIFAGIPGGFSATRYHSLAVERDSLPDVLHITAWTDDGEIMGLSHRARPVHGVQFHPESIASEHGHALLGNFLKLARAAVPVEA
jgi:anthranilate synthase component 2